MKYYFIVIVIIADKNIYKQTNENDKKNYDKQIHVFLIPFEIVIETNMCLS